MTLNSNAIHVIFIVNCLTLVHLHTSSNETNVNIIHRLILCIHVYEV